MVKNVYYKMIYSIPNVSVEYFEFDARNDDEAIQYATERAEAYHAVRYKVEKITRETILIEG